QLEQIGTTALDPEVHRVARDELRLRDLRQHVQLQAGIDVAEEDERRAAEPFGDLRREVGKDTEVRLERLGHVEVMAIPPAPAERSAFGAVEARDVDRSR